ncbi:MAG: DUF2905 domain-containing protein [Chloroflexi bacterium]|nr:DUF2905 domain-containing protein [Chloroflexota bacterium]
MSEIESVGRILILVGVGVVVLGAIVMLSSRLPGIGRLPGDMLIRRDGFVFYLPLLSCLIISVILTIVANLIFRLMR